MTLPSLPLPSFWPIVLALLAFGALGFRRGWVREVATLGGLLLSWLLVVVLGMTFVGWANRIALIATFTWAGGFDLADPTMLLRALRSDPLIDPWKPEVFQMAVFAAGAVAAYLVAARFAAGAKVMSDALLGALAGALNGYVLSYVALSYLSGGQQLASSLGVGDGATMLGGYATTVAIVVVAAIVGLAMMTTMRKPKRSGRASG